MREKLLRLVMLLFVVVALNVVSAEASAVTTPTPTPLPPGTTTDSNNTVLVTKISGTTPSLKQGQAFGPNNATQTNGNKGLLNRSLYVAVGLSAVVIIYFVIRTIRTKRRKSKTKKYGIIHGTGDMEMQPLEREDDEDEDLTVFDATDRRNNK